MPPFQCPPPFNACGVRNPEWDLVHKGLTNSFRNSNRLGEISTAGALIEVLGVLGVVFVQCPGGGVLSITCHDGSLAASCGVDKEHHQRSQREKGS